MSEQEKIEYMRLALALQRISVDEAVADTIVQTYGAILKLGSKFSIEDAVKIEMDIREKYAKKSLEADNVDKNS
jgi:outer membrane protein W